MFFPFFSLFTAAHSRSPTTTKMASVQAENLPPQVVTRLAKEVRKLATSPPEGIKFLATEEETLGEVHAEIEGPVGTPYEGFFFELKLGEAL